MSNNADIDKIFKEGIGNTNFSGRDAMWQKMEAVLDNDGRKRKKRFAFIILLACLLTAGFFTAYHFNPATNSRTVAGKIAVAAPPENNYSTLQKKDVNVTASVLTGSINNTATNIPGTTNVTAKVIKRSVINGGGAKFVNVRGTEGEATGFIAKNGNDNTDDDKNNNNTILQRETVSFNNDLITPPHLSLVLPGKIKAPNTSTGLIAKKETKTVAKPAKKVSIEVIAGCDALRMNRSAGYYVGVRVNRLLDNGTVASIGLNYNSNSVNDKYRLSSKPAEQWEADAKLNDIRSIRLPVYFQRQLAGSKFALMAGLVPSYILNATVYNVPNSFTGDPNAFRKFTMKDINRFNILFGAGIKYSPLQRVSFELSGSYGFTSLVKDSYKNKSRVNDNFKSIQAGVVFRLK